MQRSVSLQQDGGVYVGVNLFSIGCKRIFRLRSPEYKKPLTFKCKQILGFLASTQPMGRRSPYVLCVLCIDVAQPKHRFLLITLSPFPGLNQGMLARNVTPLFALGVNQQIHKCVRCDR